MKDGTRKELDELSNVVVRDVVVKLLAVLCPRSRPKVFKNTIWDGWNGIPLVPLGEDFL